MWYGSCYTSLLGSIQIYRELFVFDHSRSHVFGDSTRILFQSLEIKMHVAIPIILLRVRTEPLLQNLGSIEKKLIIGKRGPLDRRADKIGPQSARCIGPQVCKMRMISK